MIRLAGLGLDAVTSGDLWRAVGRALAAERVQAYGEDVQAYVRAHATPTAKTVRAIEDGRPGHVRSLEEYARHLRVDLPALLASVLAREPRPTLARDVQVLVDALAHPAPAHRTWQQATVMTARVIARDGSLPAPGPIGAPAPATPTATTHTPATRGTRQRSSGPRTTRHDDDA